MKSSLRSSLSPGSVKRFAVPKVTLLHERTADSLRNMIVEGDLKPGVRLKELELCELLGVSRTPLREAIRVLAAEGLVQLTPQRGAMVTEPALEELDETVEAVALLESTCGRTACLRATNKELKAIASLHEQMVTFSRNGDAKRYFRANQRFHESIVAAAHNSVMTGLHTRLNAQLKRLRYSNMSKLAVDTKRGFIDEHGAIATALLKRDPEGVDREIMRHFGNIGQFVIHPSEDIPSDV